MEEVVVSASQKPRIGIEYILEAIGGADFHDTKLYFVCLICGLTRKYSSLESHLTSTFHYIKFLAKHFPWTLDVVYSRKESSNEAVFRQILECVITEISNNTEPRESQTFNYLEYEEKSEEIETQILSRIKPYDTLEYVAKMNEALKAAFEPALEPNPMLPHAPTSPEETVEEKPDGCDLTKECQDCQKLEDDFEPPQHETVAMKEAEVVIIDNKKEETVIKQELNEDNLQDVASFFTTNILEVKDDENNNAELLESAFDPKTQKCQMTKEKAINDNNEERHENGSKPPENEVLTADVIVNSLNIIELIDSQTINVNGAQSGSQKSLKTQRQEALISMYNEKIKKLEKELNDQYELFVKNPSLHPKVNDEWKNFYLNHSFEMSKKGQYDYSAAWNVYWKQRIETLKLANIAEHQTLLKRKLDIKSERLVQPDVLSDISEDEPDVETPTKRLKLDPEKALTEIDRMLIAYQIALEHFKSNKQLSPQELVVLMELYVTRDHVDATAKYHSSDDLNDIDLLTLHKNINNLSQYEKDYYFSVMRVLELKDPERFKNLKVQFEKEDKMIDSVI